MLSYMQGRWKRLRAGIQDASAIIGIGTGVPTLMGVGAATWAYLDKVPWLAVSVLGLAVFMTALWSYLGLLSLIRGASRGSKADLDCAWGLIVELVLLSRDIVNPDAEWQILVSVRNKCNWPLKVETDEFRVEIENITPHSARNSTPFLQVITAGDATGVVSNVYKRGSIPDKERLEGNIDIKIHYGHPDVGYSRTMVRKLFFRAIVKPSQILPLGFEPPVLGGRFPVMTQPREPDADYPYVPPPQPR